MPLLIRICVFAFVTLAAVACQSTRSAHYGSGPLTLSPSVKKGFDDYMRQITPGIFVISTDGTYYYYVYCSASECMASDMQYRAIQTCETRSKKPCKVYADGRSVVWQFDAPAQSTTAAMPASAPVASAPVASSQSAATQPTGTTSRRIDAIWEGYPRTIVGAVEFQRGQDAGTMKIDLPDGTGLGVCNGTYAVSSNKGRWSLACPKGLTATGTLVTYPPNKGSSGTGTDSNGRKVSFVIAGE
jgi:hypothetical protein